MAIVMQPLTVHDWEQRGIDDGNLYEIIKGVEFVTTAPSNFHQDIIKNLVEELGSPARKQGVGDYYFAPIGLIFSGHDAVQPDFLFVRKERLGIIRNRRIFGPPDLIVEVLSPGNTRQHMQEKYQLYEENGVPEYAVVSPSERTLTYYQLTADGDYREPVGYREGDTLTFACLPSLPLAIDHLFESLDPSI